MAKGTKGAADASGTEAPAKGAKRTKRTARRLERQLARARDDEARRSRQLERARDRRAEIEGRIARLGDDAPAAGPTSPGTPSGAVPVDAAVEPHAYCMRERRTVAIVDPQPIVMRNGRPALAGACPDCGARVVTTSRAAISALTEAP